MAGWYGRVIVPQIIRFGCGCAALGPLRQHIVPKACGRVLDIGFGAGANLQYYERAQLSELVGIEPSAELRKLAAARVRTLEMPLTLVAGSSEELPFADASFDTAVSSFTLCSVEDPYRSLAEIRRVLKPGGKLLFCEHGLSPDPSVSAWQRRIEPVWKPLFGGCHLTRPVRGNVERVFKVTAWQGAYQNGKRSFAGWMEWGEAGAA